MQQFWCYLVEACAILHSDVMKYVGIRLVPKFHKLRLYVGGFPWFQIFLLASCTWCRFLWEDLTQRMEVLSQIHRSFNASRCSGVFTAAIGCPCRTGPKGLDSAGSLRVWRYPKINGAMRWELLSVLEGGWRCFYVTECPLMHLVNQKTSKEDLLRVLCLEYLFKKDTLPLETSAQYV